jgi:adenylate cyclase class 2
MLEIEMKFPVADFAGLEQRLAACGAMPGKTLDEVDHYFNAPDRDFARTDEALRIRRIGTTNLVTYKGARRDAETKTRTEIEVSLGEGDIAAADFERLLTHLGYRGVALVRKRRRAYHLQRGRFALEATLDDVHGLGTFAEIEIMAPEADLDDARAVLLETAKELGLGASERRSYLEMLLTKTATHP